MQNAPINAPYLPGILYNDTLTRMQIEVRRGDKYASQGETHQSSDLGVGEVRAQEADGEHGGGEELQLAQHSVHRRIQPLECDIRGYVSNCIGSYQHQHSTTYTIQSLVF